MKSHGDIVHSIDNAIYVLDLIMANNKPMSLKELAAVTGFPKSTIHGYLNTMRNRGLVGQDDKGNYLLGNHLFEFGMAVYNSWDFVQLTNPILSKLTQKTGKCSILSAINNDFLMNVNYFPSPNSAVQIAPCIGTAIPFHATAQGKVILASMSDDKIVKLMNQQGMHKYTDKTITDIDQLLEEIKIIRETGVGFVTGEYKPDNHVISVPVMKNGKIVFALAIMEKIDEISHDGETEMIIKTLQFYAGKIASIKDACFDNRY